MGDTDLNYPTLDRSKPFGIHTPPWGNAHFEQGGFHFTVNGDICKETLDDEAIGRLKRKSALAEAEAAADKARRAALKKAGIDPDDPQIAAKAIDALANASAADPGAGEIDLVAWAKAEKAYPFGKVRGALAEQHNFMATDTRAAIAFMVDNKLIDPDAVKVKGA